MIRSPRSLSLLLLALLLLPACGSERSGFADNVSTGDDDDDAVRDDDDTGPSDDDDDSVIGDPNCQLTVNGTVSGATDGGLTSLWLAVFREDEVNEDGFPLGGTGIEQLQVPGVQLPLDFTLCGAQDASVVLAFLHPPDEDLCLPGNLFASRFVGTTTETVVDDQDLTLDRTLTEEDCVRDDDPPPE